MSIYKVPKIEMSIIPYILKKGRTVYKGDTPQYVRYECGIRVGSVREKHEKNREIPTFSSDINQPVFFALNAYDADQYGVVMEFKAFRDFKLIEIDNLDTMTSLYNIAPPSIKNILTNNYGYNPTSNTLGIRKSEHDKDNTLSTYLCENGYDGYIILSENLRTPSGSHFHPEIAVCSNQHMFKFTRVMSSESEIDSAISDYHNKLGKPARKSKNARPRSDESPPSKTPFKSRSMFGDDDDEDNNSPNINTRLFGGRKCIGKSKRRRYNKSKRNTKKKC